MAASNPDAERAEIQVTFTATITVGKKGRPAVKVDTNAAGPVILSRPWTKAELAHKDNAKLGGDPWFEGGCAILDATHARNGRDMAAKAVNVASDLQAALALAVRQVGR